MTFRIDVADERLLKDEQPVQISNKAFQLLKLFVSNENSLLTKDQILDGVWRDLCVSEGLVKEYVHDLRTALGDDPKRPRYIETVHGRGYRFLGGVEPCALSPARQVVARSRPPSLVVLPLTDLTDDERWSRFCGGLTDDLVTDLARYPDFMVIAHNGTSIHLPGESWELNPGGDRVPEYVLSGSVQASESRVRVNVRLVETGSDKHLWTERYEQELGEVFDIQSDIVAHVASSIGGFSGQIPHAERLRLERKPPEDLEAYELFLLGHELEARFEIEHTLQALDLAERAVARDPDYARAWLLIGWSCWQILLERPDDDDRDYRGLKHRAFTRAAKLDPLDPFALIELALIRAADGDLTGARDAQERALDLGRNQPDVQLLSANNLVILLDEPTRALQLMESALRIIPLPSEWQKISMARITFFSGDFERALEKTRHGPTNLLTRLIECLSLAHLGRIDEAQGLAAEIRARHPGFRSDKFAEYYPISASGARRFYDEGIDKAGLATPQTAI